MPAPLPFTLLRKPQNFPSLPQTPQQQPPPPGDPLHVLALASPAVCQSHNFAAPSEPSEVTGVQELCHLSPGRLHLTCEETFPTPTAPSGLLHALHTLRLSARLLPMLSLPHQLHGHKSWRVRWPSAQGHIFVRNNRWHRSSPHGPVH